MKLVGRLEWNCMYGSNNIQADVKNNNLHFYSFKQTLNDELCEHSIIIL